MENQVLGINNVQVNLATRFIFRYSQNKIYGPYKSDAYSITIFDFAWAILSISTAWDEFDNGTSFIHFADDSCCIHKTTSEQFIFHSQSQSN